MKLPLIISVLTALSFVTLCPFSKAEKPAESEKKVPAEKTEDELAEAGSKLMESEILGKLHCGQSAKEVVAAYGKATTKGPRVFSEATSIYAQKWEYPQHGIELQMSSEEKDGEQAVDMITAHKSCKLVTTRGIKIGSTEKEVSSAYGDLKSKDSKAGETFVAGSIYGGIVFSFENGKVVKIFIGAAAE